MKQLSLFVIAVTLLSALNGFCQKNDKTKINRRVDPSKTNIYIVEYNFEKGEYEANLKLSINQITGVELSA